MTWSGVRSHDFAALREAFWSAEQASGAVPLSPERGDSRKPHRHPKPTTPTKAELRSSLRTPRRCAQLLDGSRFLQVQDFDAVERLRLRWGSVWLLTRHGYAQRFGVRNKPRAQFRFRRSQHAFDDPLTP